MIKAALLLGLVAVCVAPVIAADRSLGAGLLHVPGLSANVQSLGETTVGWNAGLSYNAGKLDVNAGYLLIGDDTTTPGSWLHADRLTAIRNARGAGAKISYNLSRRILLSAAGEILTPYNPSGAVRLRQSTTSSSTVSQDRLTHWKAGIQYGLSNANAISLGYEEGRWDSGIAAKERYITIGLARSLGSSSNLRLLYQISDYNPGVSGSYDENALTRGDSATAQLEMKF